jgi:hypothetical protein
MMPTGEAQRILKPRIYEIFMPRGANFGEHFF